MSINTVIQLTRGTGDKRCFGSNLIKVNISNQSVPRFFRWISNTIDPHINDCTSRLNHLSSDKIGLPMAVTKISACWVIEGRSWVRMTKGYRGITWDSPFNKSMPTGLPTIKHGQAQPPFTGSFDTGSLNEFDNSRWCARPKCFGSFRQSFPVDRVESVYIFLRRYPLNTVTSSIWLGRGAHQNTPNYLCLIDQFLLMSSSEIEVGNTRVVYGFHWLGCSFFLFHIGYRSWVFANSNKDNAGLLVFEIRYSIP